MKITFLGNFGVDFSSETHHKKSLESLGHTVTALQETQASSELVLDEAMKSDMFVWVHTHGWQTPGSLTMENVLTYLKRAKVPTVTYHLDLWLGLQRQEDLQKDAVYKHIQHFFTVDKKMADWFNDNTEVEGHYLPAGVFADEVYMSPKLPGEKYGHDVIFVGSRGYHPEWSYRPKLIDWAKNLYKQRFEHYGGDGLGVVRGDKLNQLYADTKVVIGDSLSVNFDYPYYWSDRLYETTGRGGFMIFPYIEGIEKEFRLDEELVTYKFGDFDELREKINYYLENDEEREKIRKAGFERTKKDHTYAKRWETIIREVTAVKR
jgi:glycosyl transferase family 1